MAMQVTTFILADCGSGKIMLLLLRIPPGPPLPRLPLRRLLFRSLRVLTPMLLASQKQPKKSHLARACFAAVRWWTAALALA